MRLPAWAQAVLACWLRGAAYRPAWAQHGKRWPLSGDGPPLWTDGHSLYWRGHRVTGHAPPGEQRTVTMPSRTGQTDRRLWAVVRVIQKLFPLAEVR